MQSLLEANDAVNDVSVGVWQYELILACRLMHLDHSNDPDNVNEHSPYHEEASRKSRKVDN